MLLVLIIILSMPSLIIPIIFSVFYYVSENNVHKSYSSWWIATYIISIILSKYNNFSYVPLLQMLIINLMLNINCDWAWARKQVLSTCTQNTLVHIMVNISCVLDVLFTICKFYWNPIDFCTWRWVYMIKLVL